MALVKCSECHAEISDTATSCPHCGFKPPRASLPWGWIIGAPIGLFALVMAVGTAESDRRAPADAASAERECAKAMMSNISRSTTGYGDYQAYEATVREKCAGMEIDGKPIGQ